MIYTAEDVISFTFGLAGVMSRILRVCRDGGWQEREHRVSQRTYASQYV